MDVKLSGHYSYRRIAKAALPCIVMMLVSSVYSIVDGLFISNCVGTQAFAAANLVYPALMLIGAIGIMVGSGGCALVSKTLGEGDQDKANRIFSMLVFFTLSLGVALSVLLFIFVRPIAIMLGAEGDLVPLAVTYGRICLLAMPWFMLSMAFQSFYMAAGKPHLGTIMSIVCGVTNVLLDALLVFELRLGVAGAAIATAIAQFIGGLFPIIYFASSNNNSSLRMVRCVPHFEHILRACTNGMSEYVGNIALSIVSICYNIQLMRYLGADGVAAYGVIMYVGFIFAAVFIGYNIGVAPVVGYNYGAQNHEELKSLLRRSLLVVVQSGVVLALLAEIFTRPLASIFVGYDPSLLQLTTHAMRLYMLSFAVCGLNMFVSAFFTALNNGVVSAVAAFTRTLVFELAAVFVLPMILGIDGIWLACDLAEVLSCILSIALLLAFRKRYHY